MVESFELQSTLKFNQSIVSKTLSKSALCSNLKQLQEELSRLDQSTVDRDSLQTIKKDLFTLLNDRDKFVRILVCCCIADLFRLFVPETPFTGQELKQIFAVFFKQLQYIGDATNPYFSNYYYLLDSISSVKSVVLLANLNADELIVDAFKSIFGIINPEMSQAVQVCLRDILHQLVDEFSYLPQGVVEIVIKHFSTKTQRNNNAAFRLACDLCSLVDDKFQRYVCQYFGDCIILSSRDLEDDANMDDFRETHRLILQIFEHVPTLLLNVVPQLEEELKVEDINIRKIASTTLGEMFAKRGEKWIETYPSVWKGWCDRRNDKDTSIRICWIEYISKILIDHPETMKIIEPLLKLKFVDPDDKVRTAALAVVGNVIQEHPDIFQMKTLYEIAERCRDKKPAPRFEAIRVLAKQFNRIMSYASENMELSADSFAWIPGTLMEVAYLDDPETTILLETILQEELVPLDVNHRERTLRMLQMISHFSSKQRNAFISIIDRQSKTIHYFTMFIDTCVKYNGGIMDSNEEEISHNLEKLIEFVCKRLPDPKKAETQLWKFAKLNIGRVYKLLRGVMDPSSDYTLVVKYNKEIGSRLEKNAAVMEILAIFLKRISLYLINKNTIEVLISLVKEGRRSNDRVATDIGLVAEQFIKDISKIFPALYKTQVEQFYKLIQEEDPKSDIVTDAVEALAKFVKAFPEDAQSDEKMFSQLKEMSMYGNPKQAKNAAIILAKCGKKPMLEEVMKSIVHNLDAQDYERLVCQLSCIKSVSFYQNDVYCKYREKITEFLIKSVLKRNVLVANSNEEEWIEYEDLEAEGKAKVLALQVLIKPLMAPEEKTVEWQDLTRSVMKLCRSLLVCDGELVESKDTPSNIRAHLRLQVGLGCLKLLAISEYSQAFETMDFCKIGILIQDPIYQVRNEFIERLCKAISSRSISLRYSIWLVFAAYEPELDLKNKVKSFLQRRAKEQRVLNETSKASLLEHYYLDFAHMLALHPDFSMETDDLKMMECYIKFFLETIATADNISYLFCVCAQLKTVKDKFLEDSLSLYIVSEMTNLLIREYCASNNWVLQTYPDKIGIPRDIFEKIPTEESSVVLRTVYLEQNAEYLKGRSVKTGSLIKREPRKRQSSNDTLGSSDAEELRKRAKPKVVTEDTPLRRSARTRGNTSKVLSSGHDSEEF